MSAEAKRTVLIYGLGRSGSAALGLACRQGHAVRFYDRADPPAGVARARALGATPEPEPAEAEVDLAIAAPGVPWRHPDLARLRERGVEVIGEVEWVARTVPGVYLGVTGTAGKGTVSSWLADVLRRAGAGPDRDAKLGGNVDPALAAVAEAGATHVVELSSFQLERCPTFRAAVAVVLNLGEDHVDVHGSVERYHDAKRTLVRNQRPGDTLVVNADDPAVAAWGDEAAARGVRVLRYSLAGPADAWLDGSALRLGAHALVDRSDLSVAGDHQVGNALAVALAASARGVAPGAIGDALPRFAGLPGRYAVIHDAGGLRVVEDSIATRPLAVLAALRASPPPLVWIAGGADKGADPAAVLALARERVALFVGIGQSGPALADALGPQVPHELCRQPGGAAALRCALRRALAFLDRHHGGRGTVLLAPLAASFDQFDDYRHRGRAFRAATEAEVTTWTRS